MIQLIPGVEPLGFVFVLAFLPYFVFDSLMPRDFLAGARDEYDVIVIGSGLAGMTAANTLARAGHSVLLLEQHYKLGGMATWFKRPRGHIF